MGVNPLHVIMNPSSVAVVGASNNLGKMGSIQLLNIIYGGFSGEIFPVHPTETEIFGRKATNAVADLPYAPDLALLVVPTRIVPEVLEDFGKIGTRHAIIVTAGFKETGEGGIALEAEVMAIANRYGMRFVGPNCMGIINTRLPLNISVLPVNMPDGVLAIASQSGTYITQTMPYLHRQGIAVSKAVSVGNEASIDLVDCLEFFGEDRDTKAICLYIEGIRRAERFLEVARRISRTKPIVAQYVGGTQSGARSGASHTGSLSGPDYVYNGLFEQAGIIRVDTIEDAYKIGWTLATQPPMKGTRAGILTHSGGPGSAMSDVSDRYGVAIPAFSSSLQDKLKRMLPGHASTGNPVDLTFITDTRPLVADIPRMLMESGEIDGLMVHGVNDTDFSSSMYPVMEQVIDISRSEFIKMSEVNLDVLTGLPAQHGKPLVISSFVTGDDHATQLLLEHRIPHFDIPERAARAMAALCQHYRIRQRKVGPPPPPAEKPAEAEACMVEMEASGADEFAAKALLKAYGIPVTQESRVKTLAEAQRAARQIGYPVALKACSPDILHKTEQEMVFLDLENEAALTEAFTAIREKNADTPLLVSEMLRGNREFVAGISDFPGFPPCVLFGIGGIWTEAIRDVAVRLSPLNREDAGELLNAITASDMLGPYRGLPAVDRAAMIGILMNLSRLARDFPAVKEIDLNPIMVVGGRPIVADALFVMR